MGIVVWQNCAQNVFSWHGKSCGIMLADRRRMLCWILNLIWAQILKIFWFRPQKYCVIHLHQNSKSSTSLVSPKKPSIHNMLKLCRGNKPCCASCKSDLSRNNQHQLWRNLLLRISLENQPHFLLENQPYSNRLLKEKIENLWKGPRALAFEGHAHCPGNNSCDAVKEMCGFSFLKICSLFSHFDVTFNMFNFIFSS